MIIVFSKNIIIENLIIFSWSDSCVTIGTKFQVSATLVQNHGPTHASFPSQSSLFPLYLFPFTPLPFFLTLLPTSQPLFTPFTIHPFSNLSLSPKPCLTFSSFSPFSLSSLSPPSLATATVAVTLPVLGLTLTPPFMAAATLLELWVLCFVIVISFYFCN